MTAFAQYLRKFIPNGNIIENSLFTSLVYTKIQKSCKKLKKARILLSKDYLLC